MLSRARRSSILLADSRGATAIEYAIIAALIGIGLIASLVSTRTSLSSIFGVASSQMASGTAASASGGGSGSPAVPGGPYSQKTISNFTPVYQGSQNQYKYTFTDGTSLNRTTTFDAAGKLKDDTYTFLNSAIGETLIYRVDTAGNLLVAEWDRPGPSGTTYSYITALNGQMSNGGGGVPSSTTAQTADFITKFDGMKGDAAYFGSLLTPTKQP